jgi:hypothetical protein
VVGAARAGPSRPRGRVRAMIEPLRVLIVEDSESDARLIARELRREHALIHVELIDTAEAMTRALASGPWDAIVCDWSMPSFSATAALDLLKASGLDIPFIIVSGVIGEERAVEAMRAGARDYVLKDRLSRLSPAVEREIRERAAREARRAAEWALFESQARFRALIEGSSDAVALSSAEGALGYCSPAVLRILGHEAATLAGATTLDLIHEDDRARFSGVLEGLAREPGHSLALEARALHHDGSTRWLEVTATNRLEDPAIGAVVINFRDVTDRRQAELSLRQAEDQLRQVQKMDAVGRLAGGIAHDFNNLLSVILGYSTMLAEDMAVTDPRRGDLEEITAAGERATELTSQLLAFGRRQILQPRVVDLGVVVNGMEKMLRRIVEENVELVTLLAPRLGKVRVDPGQIEQVIMNLVVNARDAMLKGGTLTIKTANLDITPEEAANLLGVVPGPHVLLSVVDTGSGMDSSTQARIFEPFFTTKPKGKGTGLGLATVFGIVQQSGGSVWVTSAPGQGTTFKIYFPELPPGELTDEPMVASRRLQPQNRGTETILLVEDDEHVRSLARTILRRHGYHVLEADDGSDARLICERHLGTIHLLLTDVMMPRINGRELAEQLVVLRPKMKILLMSGYTEDTTVLSAVHDARVAFFQKPITPDALIDMVRNVLQRP